MEHGIVIEVTNLSGCNFRLDGESLSGGEWRTDPSTPLAPSSKTRLEFVASQLSGVKGVLWWTDDAKHSTYVSMALSNPKCQTGLWRPAFSCRAGLPPANLRDELAHADALVQHMEVAPQGGGCNWVATQLRPVLVIDLCIYPELARYVPPECGGPALRPSAWAAEGAAEAPTPASGGPLLSDRGGAAGGEVSTIGKFRAQTRPKDAQDGLARGLKVAGAGLAAGVVTPMVASVKGARERGVWGFAKGLGLGLLGGCGLAAGGVAAGAIQVGRGLRHTPRALLSRREEKVWDQEAGQWVDIDLCALEAELEAESPSDDEQPHFDGASRVDVADTEYYDVLGVGASATPAEIKRAYYREARKCHPDKNPGDGLSTAKFQQLAKAYQVLSDPELRARYDSEGTAGLADRVPQMDPALFFALLFGSERFIGYTGELHLAVQLDHMAKNLREGPEELCMDVEEPEPLGLRRRQQRREVRCALFLRRKLDRWVMQRDEAGFLEDLGTEVAELAALRFGPELLVALGEIYQIRAEVYLANELAGRWSLAKRRASARRSGHTATRCLHFYRNAAGSLVAAKRISEAARREGQEGQEARAPSGSCAGLEEVLDEALPKFLRMAWAAVVRDLDGTVKSVGRKLLQDKSVPWQIRVRRAQALRVLGQVFEAAGLEAEALSGGGRLEGLTSEAAKVTLMEAVLGSVRETRHGR